MKPLRQFLNMFKCGPRHALGCTATACGIIYFTSSCISCGPKPKSATTSTSESNSQEGDSSKLKSDGKSNLRLSPKFSAILQMGDVRGRDMSDYGDKCDRLSAALSSLTAQEQSELYNLISRNITPESEIEFPIWQPDCAKWTVIGFILAETTERKLIVNILLNTPPTIVGGVSLAEFLKRLDPSVLEEVVLRGAELHGRGQ